MIRFTGIGRLGRDPETKTLPSGMAVVEFSLAFSDMKKDAESTWVKCAAFGKTGEMFAQYFHKGDAVFVSGTLREEKYTKDGVQKSILKGTVDAWEFIPKSSDNGGVRQESAPRTEAPASAAPKNDKYGDDLPF